MARFQGKHAGWVPAHADGVAMVAAVFRAADAATLRDGMRWYADAFGQDGVGFVVNAGGTDSVVHRERVAVAA